MTQLTALILVILKNITKLPTLHRNFQKKSISSDIVDVRLFAELSSKITVELSQSSDADVTKLLDVSKSWKY